MLAHVATLMASLPDATSFTPADAFAADASLLELQRAVPLGTSDAPIKKVRMGAVPDRGGRPQDAFYGRQTFVEQAREREAHASGKGGGGGKGGAGGKGGRGKGGGGGGGGGKGGGGGGRGGHGGGKGAPGRGERIVTIEPS